MLCTPDELLHKNRALADAWARYLDGPGFENFIEFAVSINSFTEFLIDKGIVALHHASHQLEQLVLSLFNKEVAHPLPASAQADLDERVQALARMTRAHAAVDLDERVRDPRLAAGNPKRSGRVWLVGRDSKKWAPLIAQLGYFGIVAEFSEWNQPLPEDPEAAPLILFDTNGLDSDEWYPAIQSLRGHFAMGRLIGLGVRPEFEPLMMALRGGCDTCMLDDVPVHAVVERIMDMNEHHDEEAHRVLIVEDSRTASHMIRRTLEENRVVCEIVNDPRQTLEALRRFNPDLILMDMYMPNCTGVEVTRVVRQHNEFLSIPIVYLSGETNVALQVDAMRLGGDHFLTKPFNPVFLNAIVKCKIERYRSLRRSMYHDSLTGLLNHSSGKNTLDMVLSGVAHEGGFLSVAMIDIDHFKQVNDTYGHPVGDRVICNLAWLLRQRLRRHDILCRYGGEEFLVALPQTSAEQAYGILERIRHDFSQIRHPHLDTYFFATLSGGIASYPMLLNRDTLIEAADGALYQAKRGGRNRISRHAP